MATKSVIEMALENIDAQMADLQRAKQIIIDSAEVPDAAPKVRKPRGKNKSKPGLPATETAGL